MKILLCKDSSIFALVSHTISLSESFLQGYILTINEFIYGLKV